MQLFTVGSGSSGNCYVLYDGKKYVILDCGIPYSKILMAINYRISDVLFVLVTHEHKDHCLAAGEFIKNGIPVFSNFEVSKKIQGVIPLVAKEIYHPSGFTVIPFKVPHTTLDEEGEIVACQNYGYYIQFPDISKMIYATDFEYIPFNFAKSEINYFLIECNHMDNAVANVQREHVLRGHSSLKTVLDMLAANYSAVMRNVILCHLSQENADPVEIKKKVSELVGDTVQVDIAKRNLLVNLQEIGGWK